MPINPDDPREPKLPTGLPPQLPQLPPLSPSPGPDIASFLDQDAQPLPQDTIGDIPPPPVPPPPQLGRKSGLGVAGDPGMAGTTFARPDSAGIRPYRTSAFQSPRFGPGTPLVGAGVSGLDSSGLGLSPEEAAELLRKLAESI